MATKVNVKHESLLENTIESLQCYKCKAVPGLTTEKQNRYSCVDESHQLCEKCKSACKCGSAVGKRPNPTTKHILKDLPAFCPHYRYGCREVFVQADDLDYHQKGCVFRQVHCPKIECKEKVLFKDVIDHLKQHNDTFWTHATGNKFTHFQGAKCLGTWMPKITKMNNGVNFILVGEVIGKAALFWLYIVSSPKEAKKYAYTLSVSGKNGRKFTYYDYVKPLDEGYDEIIGKQRGFLIGTEAIKEIRNAKIGFPVEVTIHDLKKEAKDDIEESGVEDGSD